MARKALRSGHHGVCKEKGSYRADHRDRLHARKCGGDKDATGKDEEEAPLRSVRCEVYAQSLVGQRYLHMLTSENVAIGAVLFEPRRPLRGARTDHRRAVRRARAGRGGT